MHTVKKPALEGINDREIAISPDDALELQLFELEQDIRQQAETLARKSQGHYPAEEWVMSKEDLARFKSADAKLLALQHTVASTILLEECKYPRICAKPPSGTP